MLRKTLSVLLAPAALALILLATPEASAGVIITDGYSATTPGETNDENEGTNSSANNEDQTEPVALSDDDNKVFLLTAILLNGHHVVVEDPSAPAEKDGEDGITTAAQLFEGVQGGTYDAGCAATQVSALAALGAFVLLRRRRKR